MKKRKTIAKLIVSAIMLQGAIFNSHAVKIHTIGDSTMANYDENSSDKRGWGMMFQQFFTSDVTINNRAKSGASSKSFYLESAYWTTVKTQIEAGDYVFIQFAHNDEKNGGLDGGTDPANPINGTDYRGTSAQTTYKEYLQKYVDETIALGAIPVMVTPICRKYFSGNTITRKGQHDLGDDFSLAVTDDTHDYVAAMKAVATANSLQLIDLTALTKDLYISYGDAACTDLLFCADDSTHPNALGGTLMARLCAQAMTNQNILAQYVNASSDVLVNPSDCDFGSAYLSQTVKKELTISGFDLTPATGTFTLSVSENFTIAASKSDDFASSITMDYANSNLDFAKFYIAANGTTSGEVTGTLTITNGEVTKLVPLTANFIELVGGTEVELNYELSANVDYVLTGPATAIDQSFSGMYQQKFSQPNSNTLTEDENTGWDVSQKMQRNLIEGDTWPAGEIDEVSTRYIQFGITANEGTELNIDAINLFVAGAGGNGMHCRVSYSTNNFSDYTAIREFPSMVANTVYAVSAIPVVKLTAGETLLLRVYPWYGGSATGKTICIGDVTIHGMASNATAVSTQDVLPVNYSVNNGVVTFENVSNIENISLYNLNGSKVFSERNQDTDKITVTGLSNGIYIAEFVSGQKIQTVKIFVN